MRVADFLYFAPGIRFDEINLNGSELPEQFKRRIIGFYIEPAEECAERTYAFAAGVLLVTCIDALASLRFGDKVGERFTRFVRQEIRSFSSNDLAWRFYHEFRNGLVHEGRLRLGAQFSLEIGATLEQLDGMLIVNPMLLAREVRASLDRYITSLNQDAAERRRFSTALQRDHADDFLFVERSRYVGRSS